MDAKCSKGPCLPRAKQNSCPSHCALTSELRSFACPFQILLWCHSLLTAVTLTSTAILPILATALLSAYVVSPAFLPCSPAVHTAVPAPIMPMLARALLQATQACSAHATSCFASDADALHADAPHADAPHSDARHVGRGCYVLKRGAEIRHDPQLHVLDAVHQRVQVDGWQLAVDGQVHLSYNERQEPRTWKMRLPPCNLAMRYISGAS